MSKVNILFEFTVRPKLRSTLNTAVSVFILMLEAFICILLRLVLFEFNTSVFCMGVPVPIVIPPLVLFPIVILVVGETESNFEVNTLGVYTYPVDVIFPYENVFPYVVNSPFLLAFSPTIIEPDITILGAVILPVEIISPPAFVDILPCTSTLFKQVTAPFELTTKFSIPCEFFIIKPPFRVKPVPVIAPAEVMDAVVVPALLTFIEPPLLTFIEP